MDEETWRLVARRLSGESTPDEDDALDARLTEEERERLLEGLRPIWDVSPPPVELPPTEEAVDELRRRAGLSGDRRTVADGAVAKRRFGVRPSVLLRAAVAAGILLAATELVQMTVPPPADPHLQVVAPPRQIITTRGESRRVVLSDGTRVLLAPASRIRFPERFGMSHREVRLDGSAFFDVSPDRERPFRVRTDGAITRVLGTRFAVRAYAGEREVRVAVEEGRVDLRAEPTSTDPVILEAGDLGVVAGGRSTRRPGSADVQLAWTRGRLVFRDAPVSLVLEELSRWFEVDFSASDEIGSRLITTSVGTESLEEVVTILATALEVEPLRGQGSVRLVERSDLR